MATFAEVIGGLQILLKYQDEKLVPPLVAGAEHDILYGGEGPPEESEDGRKLEAMGWHVEGACWARWV